MGNRKVTLDVSDNVVAAAVLAGFTLDKSSRILEAHATDHDKIVVKGSNLIPLRVSDSWFMIDTDTNISTCPIGWLRTKDMTPKPILFHIFVKDYLSRSMTSEKNITYHRVLVYLDVMGVQQSLTSNQQREPFVRL